MYTIHLGCIAKGVKSIYMQSTRKPRPRPEISEIENRAILEYLMMLLWEKIMLTLNQLNPNQNLNKISVMHGACDSWPHNGHKNRRIHWSISQD